MRQTSRTLKGQIGFPDEIGAGLFREVQLGRVTVVLILSLAAAKDRPVASGGGMGICITHIKRNGCVPGNDLE